MSTDDALRTILDPYFVSIGLWGRVVVLLVILGATLAATVRRSRRLVARQAEAERARSNLARYFSPNMVEELANADVALRTPREQEASVLFVDVVGFTARAAALPPAGAIALLRALQARLVDGVFRFDGTVEKYLGDGLMVTFGTPRPAPDDPCRALACAEAMLADVAAWNATQPAGATPIAIGVGVHHGPVVVGDVGDARHLELAVIGDTVNVASRLERLTRELDVRLIASDAVVAAARARDPMAAARLVDRGPVVVRGHPRPLRVWTA